MGGCRCSYRTCSMRSDGNTHMFHYPVFDKIRCHQWLMNAQKLNFLNLKVSQLKNRVVCQNHFKDDNFMNYMKDKLKYDAVPTEDGPFCDSKQANNNNEIKNIKIYPITLEDIDNEILTINEKKANFSIKYGDFLTNCDLMELESLNQINDNIQMDNPNINLANSVVSYKCLDKSNPPKTQSVVFDVNSFNKLSNQSIDSTVLTDPIILPIEFDGPIESKAIIGNKTENQLYFDVPLENSIINNKVSKPPIKENSKIKIISQKKMRICKPIKFPGKFEPISPSTIISIPKKKKPVYNLNSKLLEVVNSNIDINNSTSNVIPQNVLFEQLSVNPIVPDSISKTQSDNNIATVSVGDINTPVAQTDSFEKPSPSKSLLKTNLSPERLAAIEEKRKFNKRLRDIIESCLGKLEEQDKSKLFNNIKKQQVEKQHVLNFLSKSPELPSKQVYTLTYIESRIKRMENTLLSKIDQNSQKINDLKTYFMPHSLKKSAFTQTTHNEEHQKKHLYQQISKYLSPQANSLIYEELFINKYSQKISGSPNSSKRRRCK